MRRRELLAAAAALWAGCDREGAQPAPSGTSSASKPLRIAVIPKGTTHEFWKSVHAGAVKASRELGVEPIWKGPLKEDDLKQQIDLVQSFTAQRVSGIVLAPLNDKALVASVKGAARAGVPVVVFDSGLQGDAHVSFVATDNRKAGALAGEHLAKRASELMDSAKAKLVVLRYQEGSASTHEREEGFLEAARKDASIEIASDNQYGGATTESAFAAAESLLLAQRASDGGVQGIFAPNESTTFGMLLALEKLGLAGKIRFVGFDASDKLVKGLEQKSIDALVLQDPLNMGYLGVKTMVQHLRGEPVAKVIDTGATLVTPSNMGEPAVRALMKPDLKQWLQE